MTPVGVGVGMASNVLSHLAGELMAFFRCRRTALVNVGRKIDEVYATLRLLTRLDPDNR